MPWIVGFSLSVHHTKVRGRIRVTLEFDRLFSEELEPSYCFSGFCSIQSPSLSKIEYVYLFNCNTFIFCKKEWFVLMVTLKAFEVWEDSNLVSNFCCCWLYDGNNFCCSRSYFSPSTWGNCQ